MPFTDTTLATAQGLLAERLSDPLMVRWPAAELTRLVQEALRTGNADTASYRQTAVFNTTAAQAFQRIALEYGTPVINGIITSDDEAVLKERTDSKTGRGREFANAALLMGHLRLRYDFRGQGISTGTEENEEDYDPDFLIEK